MFLMIAGLIMFLIGSLSLIGYFVWKAFMIDVIVGLVALAVAGVVVACIGLVIDSEC